MSRRNEPRKSRGLAAGMPMPMPIIPPGRPPPGPPGRGAAPAAPGAPPVAGAAGAGSAAHAAASFSDICEYTISR